MNRRTFLRLATLVAGGVAAAGCAPLYSRAGGWGLGAPVDPPAINARDFTALNRLTFGARAEERALVAEIGIAGWIEEQLAPDSLDDSAAWWRVRRYSTLTLPANELRDRQPADCIRELQAATLLRQLFSRRQLFEVVTEFWSDHFNISIEEEPCWFLKSVDDRDVVRRHAFGNFRDLLLASAKSPAMLVYLDNQANEKSHPNENYARELLELHTLGVNGGYTQQDVMELARCLTGWSVKEHFWYGQFVFRQELHDEGTKRFLGQRVLPNGQREAEDLIEWLAFEPRTARFLARKMARRFLGEAPEEALVELAAGAFRESRGDIRAMLRVVLLDGVANPNFPLTPKYKRPLNFVTGALRALNAAVIHPDALLDSVLARMGQVPFLHAMPDGYPDDDDHWANNLLPRWTFAYALVWGELDGILPDLSQRFPETEPGRLLDSVSLALLGTPLPEAARGALLGSLLPETRDDPAALAAILTAGIIASPTFQWR